MAETVWTIRHFSNYGNGTLVAIAASRELALEERARLHRDAPETFPGRLVIDEWPVISS